MSIDMNIENILNILNIFRRGSFTAYFHENAIINFFVSPSIL